MIKDVVENVLMLTLKKSIIETILMYVETCCNIYNTTKIFEKGYAFHSFYYYIFSTCVVLHFIHLVLM